MAFVLPILTTANPPTIKELEAVLVAIIKKLTRYLEKQNIIVKDEDDNFQLSIPDEDSFSKLQASSVTYRFATGPSKGKKAMVLKTVHDIDHNSNTGLVTKNSGFSLHAGVATKADERDKLERICRYIARPAIAEERLSTNVRGEVILRFKKPWTDGTTAIKFSPMEFMERLAALVPRPRIHLTRFSGVLAPHYKFRKQIVPAKKTEPQLELISANNKKEEEKSENVHWARLLKRVFNIDVSHCPKCNGNMRIIAAIEEPAIIKKILEHLGLPSKPPKIHSARGPPPIHQDEQSFQGEECFSDFPEY